VNGDLTLAPRPGTAPIIPVATVELSPGEALGLLRAGGAQPLAPSPLAIDTLTPLDLDVATRQALVEAGWLGDDTGATPTAIGRAVLALLAAPARRTDIVLGTGSWWFTWSGLAAEQRQSPILTVTHLNEGRFSLAYPLPPHSAADLLATHLRVGHITDPVRFDAELSDAAFVAWLGVLDDLLDAQLRATLDRTPVTRVGPATDDLLAVLAEGRSSAHLAWQVPVTRLLWPELELAVGRDLVERGLVELSRHGLLIAGDRDGHQISDVGHTIADALVPVARWAGITVATRPSQPVGPGLTIERIGVRRGMGVNLVEQRPLAGGRTAIRTAGDVDLELLLATLGDVTAGGSPAALPVTDHAAFCSGCGTKLHDSAQFCHACGWPVPGAVESRRSP
jgi:hypothetical protein